MELLKTHFELLKNGTLKSFASPGYSGEEDADHRLGVPKAKLPQTGWLGFLLVYTTL